MEQSKKGKTNWRKSQDWEIRKNTSRKHGQGGGHPAIVVGDRKNEFANIGLTHSKKRGHHNNIKLTRNPNPKDPKPAFVRDDLQYDDKRFLSTIFKDYKSLTKEDVDKINKIIQKKR